MALLATFLLCIHEVLNDLESVSRSFRIPLGAESDNKHCKEWESLTKRFLEVKGLVRKHAEQGRVKLKDTLGPLSGFLCSENSASMKQSEIIMSLENGLEDFIAESHRKAALATEICEEVVKAIDHNLGTRNDYPHHIRRCLNKVKTNLLGLIEGEIWIDSDSNINQESFGLVEALRVFINPRTHQKLLSALNKTERAGSFSEQSSSGGLMKVNVLKILMDAGNLLARDIQESKAWKDNFRLLVELYDCYSNALGRFVEACIIYPSQQWSIFDICFKRRTRDTMTNGLSVCQGTPLGDGENSNEKSKNNNNLIVRILKAFMGI
ncbi:hypothetical protein SCHPADRAFT_928524 [Schizopora paradoxa]|uniref:Exocyst subunit Exo70 family protein n=1 Tax=Schizopora paradoxa TaxID=27342 RepID=A0A0H2RVM1_9AGAM|nr:hypothetical protein SCHPADRAFT_928524 [Schizopora paradoxa]